MSSVIAGGSLASFSVIAATLEVCDCNLTNSAKHGWAADPATAKDMSAA